MKKGRRLLAAIVLLSAIAAVVCFLIFDDGGRKLKQKSHPLEYSQYVEEYSEEYGLDKYLLYALIKTESGFDSAAVSDAGARGLTQIMEQTFDWIRFRLDDDEAVYDDMFDPRKNVRYGAYLMSYLMNRFGGDVETAAAAYHSGVGQVDEWLENRKYSADGKKLDTIPGNAAAHYADKIRRAYDTYTELYK